MEYSNEEKLRDGLKAGVDLHKKSLSESEKKARADKLIESIKHKSGDALLGSAQSNLDILLSNLVVDILDLSECANINLAGNVLSEISERNRNNN